MGWKAFIASLVEYLVWPVTVLIMFVLLRDQISKLIEKIAHLKYKDLELDFDKVREQSKAIQAIPSEPSVQKDPEEERIYSSLEEQILESTEKAPSASILLAWSALEMAISSAVSRLAISPESPSYRSPLHNLDMLEKHSGLPKQQIGLLHEMRVLRNKVAHEHNTTVSISEEHARDYANTALEMVSILNRIKRKGKVLVAPKGQWSQTPEGFVELTSKEASYWMYSQTPIPNTNLVAGLGPWKASYGEGKNVCYSIDIEMPVSSGSKTVAELTFALDYVSPGVLQKTASELISYNKRTREITFNLEKSTFKYQLL